MTLEQIKQIDLPRKQILIIGRPGSGKTWLAKQLDLHDFDTLHTDDYLVFSESQALQAIIDDIEDRKGRTTIIEGMLGYALLLQGAQEQSYRPDLIIEIEINAGKQREIYLADRNPDKIKYLKSLLYKTMAIIDEYFKLVPENEKPAWEIFENKWNYATEVKD